MTATYEEITWDDNPTDITEHDIQTEGLWTEHDILDAEELFEHEREYWAEVRECCNGTDFWCSHYRHYPPFMEERD